MICDLLFVLQYLERRYSSKLMRVVGSVFSVTNAVCIHTQHANIVNASVVSTVYLHRNSFRF